MPIYEYQCRSEKSACRHCRNVFEVIQKVSERPLAKCPECRQPVRKIISRCRAVVMEATQDSTVERQVKDYESAGMWSHAAELADKHSEKIKDKDLKTRALDDYKKAGYDPKFLDKHNE